MAGTDAPSDAHAGRARGGPARRVGGEGGGGADTAAAALPAGATAEGACAAAAGPAPGWPPPVLSFPLGPREPQVTGRDGRRVAAGRRPARSGPVQRPRSVFVFKSAPFLKQGRVDISISRRVDIAVIFMCMEITAISLSSLSPRPPSPSRGYLHVCSGGMCVLGGRRSGFGRAPSAAAAAELNRVQDGRRQAARARAGEEARGAPPIAAAGPGDRVATTTATAGWRRLQSTAVGRGPRPEPWLRRRTRAPYSRPLLPRARRAARRGTPGPRPSPRPDPGAASRPRRRESNRDAARPGCGGSAPGKHPDRRRRAAALVAESFGPGLAARGDRVTGTSSARPGSPARAPVSGPSRAGGVL